ncbi:MAG: CoA transferase [Dehalococcoidia bacterium]|nr:CoA transferase [Dehalococcoidia bacterium]
MAQKGESTAVGLHPLSGIRVLAVEHFRMGPHGTMMLADAGAEVIKVEPPEGEQGRIITVRSSDGRDVPILPASLSRNKKSVTINLQNQEGVELFKSLVKVSDIVWENMRPGVMDRLGVGYAVLKKINPGIIFVSLSGFGQGDIMPGPYMDRPAFDAIGQGMSGLMFAAGSPEQSPLYNTAVMADTVPSMMGAYSALVALQMRHRTGLGQHVDVAMYDNMVALNNLSINLYLMAGVKIPRGALATSAPFGPFKAQDGYVVLAVGGEKIWQRFCTAIGREDLVGRPGLGNGNERALNLETVLRPIVEGWMADKSRQTVCDLMLEHGVPAGPTQDVEDIVVCPHLEARQTFWEVDDPVLGKVKVIGNPIKMSAAPPFAPTPPPMVGQHNQEILGNLLGLSAQELDELKARGAL